VPRNLNRFVNKENQKMANMVLKIGGNSKKWGTWKSTYVIFEKKDEVDPRLFKWSDGTIASEFPVSKSIPEDTKFLTFITFCKEHEFGQPLYLPYQSRFTGEAESLHFDLTPSSTEIWSCTRSNKSNEWLCYVIAPNKSLSPFISWCLAWYRYIEFRGVFLREGIPKHIQDYERELSGVCVRLLKIPIVIVNEILQYSKLYICLEH
jgi:hypothetical protein